MTSNPINDANKSREQLLDELVALRRRVHQAEETEAELAQTNQTLQERDRMLAAFQRIGQSTLASLDLETLLDNLGREIILTGVFRSLMIALVDQEARQVEVVRSLIHRGLVWKQDFGSDKEAIRPASELAGQDSDVIGFRYDLEDDNITAVTARSGQMQVIEEWDQRFDQRFNRPDERRGKVAYFIPIKREARVLAVLGTGSTMADRDEVLHRIEAMQPLLDQVAIALEHARLYEQVLMGRNRMQELSRRLVAVQEDERRFLAHELHDEIGQVLTALNLNLNINSDLPSETLHRRLEQSQRLVEELMHRTRNLSLDLRPPLLDDWGLPTVLTWHFGNYTEQTGVQVDFGHNGLEQRFAPAIEIAAYRIVQEALTNVARHAKVQEAAVRLWVDDERLHVQIEDSGAGLDPDLALSQNKTYGLASMRERVALVGGRWTLESTPGSGTSIVAELPLDGSAEQRTQEREEDGTTD